MKRLSVAVVYHFYPHYRKGVIEEFGGANAVDVTYIGGAQGAEGIKEYAFDKRMNFLAVKTYSFWKLVFQPRVIIECLIGKYDVYVFLANPYFITTWLAALICRFRRRRVVFWGHGFKSETLNPNNRLRRIFFSLANGFYTYGWRAKENAVRLGFAPESIYVGFNSLDYRKQLNVRNEILADQVKREPAAQPSCLNILCISRITELCRYDLLLSAARTAFERHQLTSRIVFIGDGPVKSQLQRQASELGLDVAFLGAVYDEKEIAEHVFRADVTVSPGKVGLTAMHSLMYGTPVISNDDFVSQMPEVEAIVEGYTGLFFKRDSFEDLALKLVDFQRTFMDRDLIRQRCFLMIDEIYNPMKQVEVLVDAVQGRPAQLGNDAFTLFEGSLGA